MRGSEEKKIGEYTFEVYPLSYADGQKVLAKAKDLLMLKIADEGQFDEGVSPLCASVFMNLDPENLEFVVNKLAEKSRVKSDGGNYMPLASQKELVFAGAYEIMFEFLDFALEVSYRNFLEGLKKTSKRKLSQAAESNSPKD